MKLVLPTLFLSLMGFQAMSQCTPDLSETQPGLHPSIAENIAPATVGVAYSQTITVIIPADTTIEVIPGFPTTVPITKAVVTSLVGLPSGFTYACNPSNCEFPGGTTKCAIITGTAIAGQEGVYPITFYVTYYAGTLTADDTITGYYLQVNPVGIDEMNNLVSLNVSPNPFSYNASIDFYSPKGGDVKITLYNLLGKIVRTETIRANTGVNYYVLKGHNLNAGAYLVEITDGKNKTTQRLIKN